MDYSVNLWEDEIEKDKTGKVVHHPLNSRYFFTLGKDIPSYGHLTFGGHDLDKSLILDDVKVFYLEFHCDPGETDDREGWAVPLRVEVLKNLTSDDRCWYLSMKDINLEDIGDALKRLLGTELNRIRFSRKFLGATEGVFGLVNFSKSLTNILRKW